MTKRDVIKRVLEGDRPPYVPWSFSFTIEAHEKLARHFGVSDLEPVLHNHLLWMGNAVVFFEDLGRDRVRDAFGVVWDRTVDKDIGNVAQPQLVEPDLSRYAFPNPEDDRCVADMPEKIEKHGDRFRIFSIGFSLYERASTLGRDGSYILAPAHAVEGDVPLENMRAFIDEALAQPGFSAS